MAGLQFLGPYEYKPTTLVGEQVASWVRMVSAPNVENQILLAEAQKLAESLSVLEADRADKVGKCNLAGLLGPDFYRLCMHAVRTYHDPAIRQAKSRLREIQDRLRTR